MNWIRNCITLALLCIPNLAAATNTDEIMEDATSTGWYQNYYNGRTFDWAPNESKGECLRFNTGALRGLSGDYYRHMMIHGINCTDAAPTYFDAQSFSSSLPVWTFPNSYLPITTSQPQGWDWDPGYQKVTCGSNQWVSGVAQDSADIAQVQCAGSAANIVRYDNNCFVTTIGVDYNGINHGSDSNGGEWDPGYQKGYCGADAIAGISRNDSEWDSNFGGGIHALLCCPQYVLQRSSQSGHVAAVTRGDSNLEVFWVDAAGAVSHAYWNGGAWGTDMMAPAGTIQRAVPTAAFPNPGAITAVSRTADDWEVFFPDKSGSLQHAYWHTGMGLYSGPSEVIPFTPPNGGWESNNAGPGGISAVSRAPGLMDVFYVGTDRSLQRIYWDGVWHGPGVVMPGVTDGGPSTVSNANSVAAISRGPNLMDVFYVSRIGNLGWFSYGPAGWSDRGSVTLSPEVAAHTGLAVVARDSQGLEVFFVNTSGALRHAYWNTGWSSFAGPYSLTGDNVVSLTSDSGFALFMTHSSGRDRHSTS